jgi:hypothetical protein
MMQMMEFGNVHALLPLADGNCERPCRKRRVVSTKRYNGDNKHLQNRQWFEQNTGKMKP